MYGDPFIGMHGQPASKVHPWQPATARALAEISAGMWLSRLKVGRFARNWGGTGDANAVQSALARHRRGQNQQRQRGSKRSSVELGDGQHDVFDLNTAFSLL